MLPENLPKTKEKLEGHFEEEMIRSVMSIQCIAFGLEFYFILFHNLIYRRHFFHCHIEQIKFDKKSGTLTLGSSFGRPCMKSNLKRTDKEYLFSAKL